MSLDATLQFGGNVVMMKLEVTMGTLIAATAQGNLKAWSVLREKKTDRAFDP